MAGLFISRRTTEDLSDLPLTSQHNKASSLRGHDSTSHHISDAGYLMPQHTSMSAAIKIPAAPSPENIWAISSHLKVMADSKG